jgi:hypothetical protein
MSTRYFLVQMERGADVQMKSRLVPSWQPRHVSALISGADEKWESMGNARRFMLVRVTASDAKLDALDALPGVVELPDTIGPARLTRIENALAQRGLTVDLDGTASGLEAAQRVMAAVQAMVAAETPAERAALAAQMLSGN